MTITLQAVNELIASLESAGELSIREQKFLKLAKEFRICSASLDAAIKTGNMLADQNAQLAAENVALKSKGKEFLGEACAVYSRLNKLIDPSIGDFVDGQTLHEFQFVLDAETPATDAFLAGIKADGVPANIAEIIDSGDLETICYESERSYAEDFRLALYNFRQLREGAK
ncbi:TPA: hypothetical protein ACTW2L_004108 [Raoultella planticola]